jgi:WD40 repeat protein
MSETDANSKACETALQSALADYFQRLDRGEAVEVETMVLAHPSCETELRKFLRHEQRVNGAWNAESPNIAACVIRPQQQIDHFVFERPLGAGAFGTVWLARDTKLQREVAIKLPRHGLLSPVERDRFLREARMVAQLKHPHIVQIHEVGLWNDSPYLVSDVVHGTSLAEQLSGGRSFLPQEAADLCATLADALHFAHSRGVVHRDLKPANVLIDDAGRPHLTDFGLAKNQAAEATLTMSGQLVGTPAYMSPEQAIGDATAIGPAADVYSLGVVLFELLTGELPFRGSVQMLIQQVVNESPPSLRKLNSTVPRDLEVVALKCLEKAPSRRYEDAGALASDLRRYLNKEPILARPVGRIEQGIRWCHRHRMVTALVSVIFVLLATGLAVSSHLASVAQERADEALSEKQAAIISAKKARAAEENALKQQDIARRRLYASEMTLANQAIDDGENALALRLLDGQRPNAGESDLRGFEWYYMWNKLHPQLIARFGNMLYNATALDFSPTESVVAIGGNVLNEDGKTVRAVIDLWNFDSQKFIKRIECPGYGHIWSLKFSHDGKFFACGLCGRHPHCALVAINVASGEKIIEQATERVNGRSTAWSPKDNLLAGGFEDGSIIIVDTGSKEVVSDFHDHAGPVLELHYSDDGSTLYSAHLWRLDGTTPDNSVMEHDMTVNPPKIISRRNREEPLEQYSAIDIEDGFSKSQRIFKRINSLVTNYHSHSAEAIITPSKSYLVTKSKSASEVRSIEDGQIIASLSHNKAMSRLAVNDRLGVWASMSRDGETKVWRDKFQQKQTKSVPFEVLADSPRFLGTVTDDGLLYYGTVGKAFRYDLDRNVEKETSLPGMPWSYSPAKKLLVCADQVTHEADDVDLFIWNTELMQTQQKIRIPLKRGEVIRQAEISPDGRFLGIWRAGRRTWAQKELLMVDLSDETISKDVGLLMLQFAFSPDSRTFAAAYQFGYVIIYQTESGTPVKYLQGFIHGEGTANSLAFNTAGNRLAAGFDDGMIRIWDIDPIQLAADQVAATHDPGAAVEPLQVLESNENEIDQMTFFPDGSSLATLSSGKITIWDTVHAQRKATYPVQGIVDKIQITPDGKNLVVYKRGEGVEVWQAASQRLADATFEQIENNSDK